EIIEEPVEEAVGQVEKTISDEIEEISEDVSAEIIEEPEDEIDKETEIEELVGSEEETITDTLDDILTDELETIDEDQDADISIQGEMSQKDVQPVVEETPVEPAEVKTGKRTILIVDDSIVIRKMVEIALEDEELVLKTAVSGRDGLDKIDSIKPDLVILDLMLPDINGIDILKTIKASLKIPVIMLSGKDSPQMVENAKNAGADAFLPKPFKDEDLKEKINTLLEG
ncbi:MAG: response regulator, partial [Candidatus Heimdallarchaeota archaeon]|nr:response regulator [Candidatus Heimdallarchaeota archaeon]